MSRKRKILLLIIFLISGSVIMSNYSIEKFSKGKTSYHIDKVKKHKVGLVLGTSKTLKNGRRNLYFQYRIKAAVALFKAKKIQYILVSGDHGTKTYNEPADFKEELIKNGIPKNKIYLDYAGFRTLDSVIRAKEVFGQTRIVIISQEFHNKRAIYLAEKNGIQAFGFNAKSVNGRNGIRTNLREYFARTKVFLDIIFGVQPKYLGKKIEII
ncbi:SanA/YdcF family protein [Aquimarina aquimarini]|uniref:SanA/YdcF family protein n=1 Tax=Aquimarina aquimarini TaxID=1191734 RepID=UPI000D54FA2B|nr:ElyC/SanA/YdcF family protein [Aquimarina aquimarini]